MNININLYKDDRNSILPLRFVNEVLENDSITSFVKKGNKAYLVTIPVKKNYNNGFIIPEEYNGLQFIETFRELEEGVSIKNNP